MGCKINPFMPFHRNFANTKDGMSRIDAHVAHNLPLFRVSMADPLRFIGRIAKLKNDSSYVRVKSYDSDAAEYAVKALSEPTAGSHRVKPSDLKFQTTPQFDDLFPNAPHFVIRGRLDMRNIPSGSVVDFRECFADPIVDGGKLFVRGSYRFIGRCHEFNGCFMRPTILRCCVFAGTLEDDDIIEFENILFVGDAGSRNNLLCLRGNITFRSCEISGAMHGMKIGSGNAPVKVLYEAGVMKSAVGSSVVISADTELTMVGVELKGLGAGVIVEEGGIYTAQHCTFSNHAFGLLMGGIDSKTNLVHCTFQSSRWCSVLINGGTLSMTHCEVTNAQTCGVIIVDQDGWVETKATLESCRITTCVCGIRISGAGACQGSDLTISDCTVGVYLTGTSRGDVSLLRPQFGDNTINMVNLNVENARLTIDSIVQPSHDILKRLQDVNDTVFALPAKANELSDALSTAWPLKVKQFWGRCDMFISLAVCCHFSKLSQCNYCGRMSTTNTGGPYKKCSRCKQVRYCSKRCQVDDWSLHKEECRMSNDWYKELWRMRCVCCRVCQKVMVKGGGEMVLQNRLFFCRACAVDRKEEVALFVTTAK